LGEGWRSNFEEEPVIIVIAEPEARKLSQDMTLEELLKPCCAGDTDAARELYQRYDQQVIRAVQRKMTQGNWMMSWCGVEDCLQEAWMVAFLGIRDGKAFESGKHLVRYIAKVCRNRIRMALRKGRTQKRTLDREEALGLASHDAAAPGMDPAAQAELEDELQHLLRDEPEQRKRLAEAVFGGESIREAALRLKMSPRTAQYWMKQLGEKWRARKEELE
jgi:RNA polymerase sigma factor (sigma-70 family)